MKKLLFVVVVMSMVITMMSCVHKKPHPVFVKKQAIPVVVSPVPLP